MNFAVAFFLLIGAFESLAGPSGIENVSLKTAPEGNSTFVDCVVAKAYSEVHTDVELFDVGQAVIEEAPAPDVDLYASIRTLGKNKTTGKFVGISITLRAIDPEKWFYIQSGSQIFPYSHKIDTLATTSSEEKDLPAYLLLAGC